MSRRRLLLAAFAAVGPARAQQDSAWKLLRTGGFVLLLRHAATEPGIGDPPNFKLGDCSTQRNLSAVGREQASRFGARLREEKVRVDAVLSSQWCRCVDTAKLMFPSHEVRLEPALNSFFDRRADSERQTQALARLIADVRAPRVVVMVTHQVNISALTGQPVAMGEAVLVRVDAQGAVMVADRLQG